MTGTKLQLYPSFKGYVGKLNVISANKSTGEYTMIVILDRSGSMGGYVNKIVTKTLPSFLELIKYPSQKDIILITFDDQVDVYRMNAEKLIKSDMDYGGRTYMKQSIVKLEEIINSSNDTKFRILSFSDGVLHDQHETVMASSAMASRIDTNKLINSQAIRLFTSSNQPDTRGLTSVMQFNNVTDANLLDISGTDIIQSSAIIASMFENDGINYSIELTSSGKSILTSPYQDAKNSISVRPGLNTIWFNELPDNLTINGDRLEYEIMDSLSNINFSDIMGTELNNFMNKIKILKIVNTQNSSDEIQRIIEHFSKLEKWLASADSDTIDLVNNTSLNTRVKYFKNLIMKRKKSFFQQLLQIANDDRVSKLNSAQQADYLRNTDFTKLGKALARRAEKFGLDFTSTLQEEINNVCLNIRELDDIDDVHHKISFYSQDSTLGGLRALAELVTSDMLNDLDANEILQMSNIVGVACEAEIGDYPDPMTWRVNTIYPGCYLSVSDIMTAHEQSGGQSLSAPGFDSSSITNVIPIFDDPRIGYFMKKYCPTLLEYSASVGMRRVITGISTTNLYTVCGGLRKMIELLDTRKTELNILTFSDFTKTYDICAGIFFKDVLTHVKYQDTTLSYYIDNNGITNMIHPIYTLVNDNNVQYMSRILRAMYSFEAAQVIRRELRVENSPDANDVLNELLGIDFVKYGLTVTPAMEKNIVDPKFHRGYVVDDTLLNSLSRKFRFADYCVLIPTLFEGLNNEDPIKCIQNIDKMDNGFKSSKLGITYDIQKFKFYTLIQSLLHPTKNTRVDDENSKMKIVDIGDEYLAEKMVADYVERQYSQYYYNQMVNKRKEESIIMIDNLISDMLASKTISSYVTLFQEGVTYNDTTYQIKNTCSFGYTKLSSSLIDMNLDVPHRCDKIKIMILGRHNDEIVWNNGGVLFADIDIFKDVFTALDHTNYWDNLYKTYIERKIHVYRDFCNRHGHSNVKPSYWAYGYNTIEAYRTAVSSDEWNTYKSQHVGCCGL